MSTESYRDFLDRVHGAEWMWPAHVEHVVDAVGRWIDGEWDHLGIYMPQETTR